MTGTHSKAPVDKTEASNDDSTQPRTPQGGSAVRQRVDATVRTVLDYHRRGWAVIDVPLLEKNPGRRGWQNDKHDEASIRATFGQRPCNVGLLMGPPSGNLVDLDQDDVEWAALAPAFLPETDAVFGRAGKQGSHRLYRCDPLPRSERFTDPVSKEEGGLGTIGEVRSNPGHLTIFPGSVHSSGEPIEWERDGEPAEVDAEELRAVYAKGCAYRLLQHHWPGPNSRHEPGLALVGGLLRADWSEADVEELLRFLWSSADEGQIEGQVRTTAARLASGDGEVTGWPTLEKSVNPDVVKTAREWLGVTSGSDRPGLSDIGNAERFVLQHGDTVRFIPKVKSWLVWDGLRWKLDERGLIKEKAKETIRSLFTEAASIPNPDEQKKVATWALASSRGRHPNLLLERAESDQRIVATLDELDTHPWLVTVANGTLDLQRGELRPSDQADLITKRMPVAWDPNAECATWLAFVQSAMSRREGKRVIRQPEMEAYLQRLIGYCLSGDTKEKMLPVAWGDRNTGKTTLTEVLRALFGEDYSGVLGESSIASTANASGTNHDVADYRGTRLLVVSETAESLQLNESRIKAWTGGNPVRARHLFKEYFVFTPQYKIFIETNSKPVVNGSDNAVWYRLKLIPFLNEIAKEDQDPRLEDKLKAELPGILSWAVAGFIEWQRLGGLKEPQQVVLATSTYKAESDPVAAFFEDRCVFEEGARVRTAALYDAYASWVPKGEKALSRTLFVKHLEDEFKLTRKTVKGNAVWDGVKLADKEEAGDALFTEQQRG